MQTIIVEELEVTLGQIRSDHLIQDEIVWCKEGQLIGEEVKELSDLLGLSGVFVRRNRFTETVKMMVDAV